MKLLKYLSFASFSLILSCKNQSTSKEISFEVSLQLDANLDTIINKKNIYQGFYKSVNYKRDTTVYIDSKPIKGEIYTIPIDFLAKQDPIKLFLFELNNQPAICVDSERQGFINFQQIHYTKEPFTIRNVKYQIGGECALIPITATLQPSTLLATKSGSTNTNSGYGLGIQFINRYGYFNLDTKTYIISVNDYFFSRLTKNGKYQISIIDSSILNHTSKANSDNIQYSLGDTIFLGSNFYRLHSVKNNLSHIYLTKVNIDTKSQTGLELGNYFPENKYESLVDSTISIKIGGSSQKYTLLDFWGTWCQPCVESTETLKTLKNRYNDKIHMISIASDFIKQDVIRHIKGHQMTWDHIFENYSSKVITTKYKITAFPTFILLDKKGKILFRGSGKEALWKVENILVNL